MSKVCRNITLHVLLFLQKLQRRTLALTKADWEERKKKFVESILKPEYMSSEESDEEEQERQTKRRPRVVCLLKNESKQCQRYKRDLDKTFIQCFPRQAECMVVAKRNPEHFSQRSIPSNPSWVCEESQ